MISCRQWRAKNSSIIWKFSGRKTNFGTSLVALQGGGRGVCVWEGNFEISCDWRPFLQLLSLETNNFGFLFQEM